MHFLRYQLPALIALVAGIINAHIIMESPVPYGADHLDSNPLLADGSDYPCKQRDNVYKVIKQNVMPIGQNQTLSFIGQATHGGGSCQISLTTDKQPSKNSVWKVIHSIEGGCPSPAPGNLGDNPMGHGTDKFQFSIPQQVPTGDYTLAWTWFNKIGNREMYMNCAPITVTGSSSTHKLKRSAVHHRHGVSKRQHETSMIQKRADALASLPNMFLANIGNGCNTAPSGTTLAIPQQNLGTSVDHHAPDELVPPVGSCGGAAAAAARPQGNTSPAPASSMKPQAPPPAPSSQPAPVSIPTVQPNQPPPPPAPAVPQTPQSQSPPAQSPAAQAPAQAPAAPAAPAAPPAPVPSGYSTGKCTTPGKSVCAPDGMGIGTCDEKGTVMFAPAPMGTKCDASLGVLVHARGMGVVFKA